MDPAAPPPRPALPARQALPALPARATLPATAYPVLGLLSGGAELSGYDLKKWADASLNFFYWSPALSHIYTELRRLERLGYVEPRVEQKDEVRHRRLYRITPAGMAVLTEWVRSAPIESPVLKHSVALRVWLGHLVGIERVREIIDEHLAATTALLDDVRASRAKARTDPPHHYSAAVIAWTEDHYEAELASFSALLRRLEETQEQR
jgi:DNA-binding PadR family transcriptional regulator